MAAACVNFNLIGAFRGLSLGSSSSSSYLRGDFGPVHVGHKVSVSFQLKSPLTIESAHKKGAGSTKNGRDSPGQRLGVKIFGDQFAKPGAIIVRQRGTKIGTFLFLGWILDGHTSACYICVSADLIAVNWCLTCLERTTNLYVKLALPPDYTMISCIYLLIVVIVRLCGFHPGTNVGIGRDHTIFSLIDGLVKFEKFGPDRKKVSVYPRSLQPENPNSYRARKRESFRLQRERRKARREANLLQPQLVLASAIEASDGQPEC